MGRIHKILIYMLLVFGIMLTGLGLYQLQWPNAIPWQEGRGIGNYILFFMGSLVLVGIISIWKSRRPFYISFFCAVALAIFAGAFWPLLVALWFCLSSILLGRSVLVWLSGGVDYEDLLLCFITGAGLFGVFVSFLAHFSVNYPGVYGAGLALPLLFNKKTLFRLVHSFNEAWGRSSYSKDTSWSEIGIAAIGLIYVVVALMPEFGYDPLVMHLFVPSHIFYQHEWQFDVSKYVWAVMPMQADWLFSIGYMLAGEAGARLVNIVFLFALMLLVRKLVIWAGGSKRAADVAALILLTTPLTFTEGSSLYVEAVWSVFLIAAGFMCCRLAFGQHNLRYDLPALGVFVGCALSTKAITFLMLPILMGVLIWRYKMWLRRENMQSILIGITLAISIGCIPYLYSWFHTGNPVFPFFNKLFESSHFPDTNFNDMRWHKGIPWNFIYKITFHSGDYLEARPGAPGFQWILLFLPSIYLIVVYQLRRGLLLIFLALLFLLLVFHFESYLRYVYPAFVVLIAVIGLAVGNLMENDDRMNIFKYLIVCTIMLNILFLNAGSSYQTFPLREVFDTSAKQAYLAKVVPIRAAISFVNQLNTTRTPVAFLSSPFGAGLNADAIYANWYNLSFSNALYAVQTDKEALDLLLDNSINFVILDKKWQVEGGKYKKQLIHIENVTKEIAAYGTVSVRRINPHLLFHNELLKNPNFKSKEGWTFAPGAIYESSTNSVLVSEPANVSQSVTVKAGLQYRNVVVARCAVLPAVGRLQINWYDAKGNFLKANIITFNCSHNWTEYEMTTLSPPAAARAVVYAAGNTTKPLFYRRNSLLK